MLQSQIMTHLIIEQKKYTQLSRVEWSTPYSSPQILGSPSPSPRTGDMVEHPNSHDAGLAQYCASLRSDSCAKYDEHRITICCPLEYST